MLNQKSTLALSLWVIMFGLTACQKPDSKHTPPSAEQSAASQVPPDTSLLLQGDTEKLKLTLPECDGNSCPEFSVDRLQSNQAFIDEIIDQAILDHLEHMLDIAQFNKAKNDSKSLSSEQSAASAALDQTTKTPTQQLQERVQPYTRSFLELHKELQNLGASSQINLSLSPKILNSDLPLATVVLNSSSYLGGAHGSSAQTYFNFDLKTKKQVQLEQILEPNKKAQLNQLAHTAFQAWVIDSKLAENVAEYEQAWKFTLSNNFYLGKQGLILQYGEYDIGPYVVGLPRLTIPYDQLKGVLKAQYLPAEMQVDQPSASSPAAQKVP